MSSKSSPIYLQNISSQDSSLQASPTLQVSPNPESTPTSTISPLLPISNMSNNTGVYNQMMDIVLPSPKDVVMVESELDELLGSLEELTLSNISKRDAKKKLTSVFKKYLGPVINKSTLETRIRFSKIINGLLDGIEQCLSIHHERLALIKNNEPIVYFSKRIGTESKYGMVYMSTGTSYGRLLKFATKFTKITSETQTEMELLKRMSKIVLSKQFPNMPISYKIMNCYTSCKDNRCPIVTETPYFVIINELADFDLITWFEKEHTSDECESIIMQLILALHCFHSFGYSHNDTHLGNFLVHKIPPGGHWRYKIGNNDIYVPNTGYLLVLWDPGKATEIDSKNNIIYDYTRPLYLMIDVHSHYKNTISIKSKETVNLLETLFIYLSQRVISITDFGKDIIVMKDLVSKIKSNVLQFRHIKIDTVPDDFLLNIKPFVIKDQMEQKKRRTTNEIEERVSSIKGLKRVKKTLKKNKK